MSCRWRVSEIGYHAWKKRERSAHAQQDQELAEQIMQIFHANWGVYGSPRIHAELQARGKRCSRKRVARLMQERGISAQRKRRRVKTTVSNPDHPVASQSAQSRVCSSGSQLYVGNGYHSHCNRRRRSGLGHNWPVC
ncbi:IS3 family transposase [Dictyobacter kobayashii]|uniref:IS3 family transposase n=1 Tax=Dictyobacter kobayashii TaxID=2014872 RepID=UPI000F819A6B|nr:IS3 family transposase [Dictyobacter kobayashii]